eukprot:TRINITY_DN6020_c0_g2_i1.p1 TRINITY_DN6020_c0_g2~~TRINITY_DN6020_c0_g2_i1.p1  ORF type:complete len:958 (+),score=141.41 TRINITY_DN6020_c0_g2_i1:152-2875(+)
MMADQVRPQGTGEPSSGFPVASSIVGTSSSRPSGEMTSVQQPVVVELHPRSVVTAAVHGVAPAHSGGEVGSSVTLSAGSAAARSMKRDYGPTIMPTSLRPSLHISTSLGPVTAATNPTGDFTTGPARSSSGSVAPKPPIFGPTIMPTSLRPSWSVPQPDSFQTTFASAPACAATNATGDFTTAPARSSARTAATKTTVLGPTIMPTSLLSSWSMAQGDASQQTTAAVSTVTSASLHSSEEKAKAPKSDTSSVVAGRGVATKGSRKKRADSGSSVGGRSGDDDGDRTKAATAPVFAPTIMPTILPKGHDSPCTATTSPAVAMNSVSSKVAPANEVTIPRRSDDSKAVLSASKDSQSPEVTASTRLDESNVASSAVADIALAAQKLLDSVSSVGSASTTNATASFKVVNEDIPSNHSSDPTAVPLSFASTTVAGEGGASDGGKASIDAALFAPTITPMHLQGSGLFPQRQESSQCMARQNLLLSRMLQELRGALSEERARSAEERKTIVRLENRIQKLERDGGALGSTAEGDDRIFSVEARVEELERRDRSTARQLEAAEEAIGICWEMLVGSEDGGRLKPVTARDAQPGSSGSMAIRDDPNVNAKTEALTTLPTSSASKAAPVSSVHATPVANGSATTQAKADLSALAGSFTKKSQSGRATGRGVLAGVDSNRRGRASGVGRGGVTGARGPGRPRRNATLVVADEEYHGADDDVFGDVVDDAATAILESAGARAAARWRFNRTVVVHERRQQLLGRSQKGQVTIEDDDLSDRTTAEEEEGIPDVPVTSSRPGRKRKLPEVDAKPVAVGRGSTRGKPPLAARAASDSAATTEGTMAVVPIATKRDPSSKPGPRSSEVVSAAAKKEASRNAQRSGASSLPGSTDGRDRRRGSGTADARDRRRGPHSKKTS